MLDLERDCCDLPLRTFDKDEIVIREGGRSGNLYFLVDGEVEISRDGVMLARIHEPGAILGEVAVLLGRPHMADVRAVRATTFRVAEDPESFLRDHPGVNLRIAQDLAKKVDAMSCYLVDLKRQYADESNHLGMVGEVLDSILQHR
ncbi:MAG: cyclic nucleotide-binding domain-containing protein [Akkermansiaceae bacterium]|nr:cyclic nucleotide-binding domain-containing protein [Akkermansiaceae bacterium]MCP5545524.1 cyclic nucleotide-binding domain-containing protein [Akkermansiaceae bacterium]MCP5545769.1 cyclic nucleotide-binding domain-containing protein [Akkermansiaceae bacterium]